MSQQSSSAPLISPESIAVVKATAPVVAQHALEITKTFYPIMFKNNPEALQFFNKTNQQRGRQPQALANAVIAFASNIESLGNLANAVDVIAHKHCGLNVLPEHYQIVEKNIMIAIKEVLGEAITPEVGAAWKEAITALSKILYTREEELYKQAESRPGGWRGWKEFEIVEKNEIAEGTMYIKMSPVEGRGTNFHFTAGQFITIQCPELEQGNPRHYTIVSPPGANYFAIAVKRCTAPPDAPEGTSDGVVSNHLFKLPVGSKVNLSPPFGMFGIEAAIKAAKPIMLLSAGCGGNTARAHMYTLRREEALKKVMAVHQDHQRSSHAWSSDYDDINHFFKYTLEDSEAFAKGHISQNDLLKACESAGVDPSEVLVFLCGPLGFMADVTGHLDALGVPKDHIIAEVFGPQLATPDLPLH